MTSVSIVAPTSGDADAGIKESRDSIRDVWGLRTPYYGDWPVRVDERTHDTPDDWVQSACVMCSNGCGMDIGVKDGRIVGVRGRAVDRVNHGRLGPKGLHCIQANHSADRLTEPLVRRNGKLEPASWDEAMTLIVDRSKSLINDVSRFAIGHYTTGQLFLEEYYTLALVGKAGLKTLHMDGNTRLCTASAATAMRESFGSDGQPGSYTDIDTTECIFIVGHNVAYTQTVLWTRMLDRLKGPRPPKLIVMDPRRTATAAEADVHIIPRAGTNLAVLNGILHLLFKNNQVDYDFIEKHTVGIDNLRDIISRYTPEYVENVSGVPANILCQAAHLIGTTTKLLSTALQGVYQSNQAVASACAINNINLVRGMIGRSGCGIYQMNGQPTAQNNREAGCNGEYPGFRNQENIQHMKEIAQLWNIKLTDLPHYSEPTHIMNMLKYIEDGSMKMFWVSGTNPLVSLPDLNRIRSLFTKPDLFLVVQDIFMTETAQLADVVLPAAMWGEKTGCFTNVDRTVHISYKAIEPPGIAKSDFDIFLDYAKRMDFRDQDNQPLIKWSTPEECFNTWAQHSKGRPCDYSGMSYQKLTGGSGIQWPCNEEAPNGTERLYSDAYFMTAIEDCESYGHDLETGTAISKDEYSLLNPAGRAIFKSAHYIPPLEQTSEEYPYTLATGRDVFQFHTRTKTGRDKHLNAAAPGSYVQISSSDAEELLIKQGEMVAVSSKRGTVIAPAKVGNIDKGQVFVPFHYGYWDAKDDRPRAGNELTVTGWDAISKQPFFKSGVVKIEKVPHDTTSNGELKIFPKEQQSVARTKKMQIEEKHEQKQLRGEEEEEQKYQQQQQIIRLPNIIQLIYINNQQLIILYEKLSQKYIKQWELFSGLKVLIGINQTIHERLTPMYEKYTENTNNQGKSDAENEILLLINTLFSAESLLITTENINSYMILRDMHKLFTVICSAISVTASLVPTAAATTNADLIDVVGFCQTQLSRQQAWTLMRCKLLAPQTLLVPT